MANKNEKNHNAYYLKGLEYESQRNYVDAIKSYEEGGNNISCLIRLGGIYWDDNNLGKAIECFKKAINLGDSSAKLKLADLYLENDINRDDAIKLLKEEINEGSHDALIDIISKHLDTELFKNIYAGYKKCKKNNKKYLSTIYWDEGDYTKKLMEYWEESLDAYIEIEEKYKALEEKYNLLKAHLEYSPDGPGYLEAEKDFLNLTKK